VVALVLVIVGAALLALVVATWRLMRAETRGGKQSSDPTTEADWMGIDF
jgi:hypothetical protein